MYFPYAKFFFRFNARSAAPKLHDAACWAYATSLPSLQVAKFGITHTFLCAGITALRVVHRSPQTRKCGVNGAFKIFRERCAIDNVKLINAR